MIESSGRIVVLVAKADARHDAFVQRLRIEHGHVETVAIRRGVADDIASAEPDVVLIIESGFGSRLLRCCQEVRSVINGNGRIVVVGCADAPGGDAAVISMLDAGVDDYIAHETSIEILMARVRVAMRARSSMRSRQEHITVGDLSIDLMAHEVRIGGIPVKCPPQQYELLVALGRHPEALVSREQLSAVLWPTAPATANPRRLRSAISLLRAVLGTGPQRPSIKTTAHYGYRLVPADD